MNKEQNSIKEKTEKQYKKSRKKVWFFEKLNKIVALLAIYNKKKEKTQMQISL